MVNPGYPSKGCTTCKLRHIKCDEGRPTCQKCVSSRRMCLGYDSPRSPVIESTCGRSAQSGGIQDPIPSRSLESNKRGNTPTQQHGREVQTRTRRHDSSLPRIQSATEIINTSFQSLHETAHTPGTRRTLHKRYQSAIQNLGATISSSHGSQAAASVSAYLFALYEVCMSLTLTTWSVGGRILC